MTISVLSGMPVDLQMIMMGSRYISIKLGLSLTITDLNIFAVEGLLQSIKFGNFSSEMFGFDVEIMNYTCSEFAMELDVLYNVSLVNILSFDINHIAAGLSVSYPSDCYNHEAVMNKIILIEDILQLLYSKVVELNQLLSGERNFIYTTFLCLSLMHTETMLHEKLLVTHNLVQRNYH